MPLIRPTTEQQTTAARHAGARAQPCWVASTGTIVAERPSVEAIDRSNSPTTKVSMALRARKTNGCWLEKMLRKVSACRKVSGISAEYITVMRSQMPTMAYLLMARLGWNERAGRRAVGPA